MSLEMFKAIIDKVKEEMPGVSVVPWLIGEPFLNRDYLEMVKYLSVNGLRFYVTTNLTIWREDILRFLLSKESTCYQIIVSMDGLPDSGNIEIARPGTNEKVLLNNLEKLLAIKTAIGSDKDIAVKICARGQDWGEIEDYVQYWLNDAGIDYVCVGKILVGDNEIPMRTKPCQYFDNQFMEIRWNGELAICSYNNHVIDEHALSYGQYKIGDSLLELYNNEAITKLREDQHNGVFPWPCSVCSFAYTGYGFRGEVQFRDDKIKRPIYYQQDYYNMFFSLKRKWKPAEYYK
jgi:MoaA/NifB/PqqE/SkfB family radical SAM enzyme